MILDTARIGLLEQENEKRKACATVPSSYLIVFQAQIGDATHGRRLALG
jgi:hypothetical protein